MSRVVAASASLFVLSALIPAADARGDTQNRTRVTIRGTGSDVVIERSEAPVRKHVSVAAAVPAGPLDEAVRLKAQGANDSEVISYLRLHEAEMPPVVDSEYVTQLRKAGAGKGVVAYLTTVAAVDIGETGEGYEAAVSAEPVSQTDLETAPYGVPDGYAFSGGYGPRHRAHVDPRRFPHLRRMATPSQPQAPQRHVSSRSGLPRYRPGY